MFKVCEYTFNEYFYIGINLIHTEENIIKKTL